MGSSISKSTENIKDDSSENSLPSAPISTPQIKKLDWDPRSPSSDIARTPIEVLKTPMTSSKTTPTNNALDITEDLDQLNILNHLNPLDPRSPTTEFHRTPIVVEPELKLQTIRNKNLDKVREPLVVITPAKPKRISQRVVKKIYTEPETIFNKSASPKLLESSPITVVKPPENKRHSLVGLLETNIDFVETDLDQAFQNKIHDSKIDEVISSAMLRAEDLITHDVLKENDSSSDSDYEEANYIIKQTIVHTKHNEFTGLPDLLQETNDPLPVATEIKNGSIVNELDRKLTNLIYEDKLLEASPKPSKPLENNHTPLRDRNMNSQLKSIPQLKVSDKPTKPLGGSRIPVFNKEKRVKGKINVQCENTPPRIKPKRSQWDPEDSIII